MIAGVDPLPRQELLGARPCLLGARFGQRRACNGHRTDTPDNPHRRAPPYLHILASAVPASSGSLHVRPPACAKGLRAPARRCRRLPSGHQHRLDRDSPARRGSRPLPRVPRAPPRSLPVARPDNFFCFDRQQQSHPRLSRSSSSAVRSASCYFCCSRCARRSRLAVAPESGPEQQAYPEAVSPRLLLYQPYPPKGQHLSSSLKPPRRRSVFNESLTGSPKAANTLAPSPRPALAPPLAVPARTPTRQDVASHPAIV